MEWSRSRTGFCEWKEEKLPNNSPVPLGWWHSLENLEVEEISFWKNKELPNIYESEEEFYRLYGDFMKRKNQFELYKKEYKRFYEVKFSPEDFQKINQVYMKAEECYKKYFQNWYWIVSWLTYTKNNRARTWREHVERFIGLCDELFLELDRVCSSYFSDKVIGIQQDLVNTLQDK